MWVLLALMLALSATVCMMENVIVSYIVIVEYAAKCTIHLWHARVHGVIAGTLIPIAAVSSNGDLMLCMTVLICSLVEVAGSVANVTIKLFLARVDDVSKGTLVPIADHQLRPMVSAMNLANDVTSGTQPVFVLRFHLSLEVALFLFLLLICSTGLLLISVIISHH
jgi:hypothetical protein